MAAPSPFDNVTFPSFSELPFRKDDPPGAIWGFYEHVSKSEAKDELGALNLLTPSRILRASQNEIKTGKVCSLNWELHKPFPAAFGRKGLEHNVFWMKAVKSTFVVDDEVSMNTQCGSQWDGFKHFSYYATHQFYNGLDVKDVLDESQGYVGKYNALDKPMRNGIQKFQGKIVGRGVLLDYFSYAQTQGKPYAPSDSVAITAQDLEDCAKAQGLQFEQGDILFVRTGYIHWFESATEEERENGLQLAKGYVGVRPSMEEVEWLWDHHFAAVASDCPSFEALPTTEKWSLHDYLLPLWGTPIGEFFDLEKLSETCKELGRYSFFLTSSPLNVVNGIASPPNAMAIF